MSGLNVTDEFSVRYYRWAILDSRQEMDAGFPLVSRLRNESTETYLSIMSQLDATRRHSYLVASVKRFHPQAIGLLDEGMTREEETLLEWADTQRFNMTCAMPRRKRRFSTRRLKASLESALLTHFGHHGSLTKPGPNMLGLEPRYGPWLVRTWFDCARSPHYFHHIASDEISLASFVSIHAWMGITSMTDWTWGPANSEEEIAKMMVDAAQRFLDRVPELLEGLSPRDHENAG